MSTSAFLQIKEIKEIKEKDFYLTIICLLYRTFINSSYRAGPSTNEFFEKNISLGIIPNLINS
jgi:hypothetical protein